MHHSELASHRRSLGLSQDELAKKIGVTTNTVARWERGELRIQHPEMLRWALRAIEDEMSYEERDARNQRAREEMLAKMAEEDANPSPERDAAERWFGKH